MFQTTMADEYKFDIYGERDILLGAVHDIENLFRRYARQGMAEKEAFINTSESITGPQTQKISKRGILAVYTDMDAADKAAFEQAYTTAYMPAREILEEVYNEVASGLEIRSVIMATEHSKGVSHRGNRQHSDVESRREGASGASGAGGAGGGRAEHPTQPHNCGCLHRHHDGSNRRVTGQRPLLF